MITNCYLTTVDNPYSPYDQFEEWIAFDIEHGYSCCELLDRIARTSDSFSDEENDEEIDRAIKEIIKHDFRDIYRKYVKNNVKPLESP